MSARQKPKPKYPPESFPPRSDTPSGSPPRSRTGFALESVLMLMVMFSVIILAGLSAVTSLSRSSNADYRASRATYAAEGGADDIMSQLDAAMQDGIINGSDIASIQTPALPGYRFAQSTQTIGVPVSKTITSGPFSGLYSLNQPIDIRVTARDSSGNRATSVLSVNAQTIPLFQFGVFYEGDLEILPGQVMTFAGWVHTNGNLYLSSNTATFQSQITTPDSVFWQRKDMNQRLGGVRINNAAASAVLLDFDSRSLFGAAFVNRSQTRFSGRLMTEAHGVRPLFLALNPQPMRETRQVVLLTPRAHSQIQQKRFQFGTQLAVQCRAQLLVQFHQNLSSLLSITHQGLKTLVWKKQASFRRTIPLKRRRFASERRLYFLAGYFQYPVHKVRLLFSFYPYSQHNRLALHRRRGQKMNC